MTTLCAPVDQRALRLRGLEFHDHVDIIAQPIYGRILFTSHDVIVENCSFPSLELHGPFSGAFIVGCCFGEWWSRHAQ